MAELSQPDFVCRIKPTTLKEVTTTLPLEGPLHDQMLSSRWRHERSTVR